MPDGSITASRRSFLKTAGGAGLGLTLGFVWAPGGRKALAAAAGAKVLAPNAFVRVAPDNTVTVLVKHLEMGQGVMTGLATIVAEELDADWSQMRAEHAPADAKLYNNLAFGPVQGTGGSTSVANSWTQLRKAAAAARAMLVQAAAQRWGVPAAELSVAAGTVTHAKSGRKATFGELAEAASALPVPADAALKDSKDFRLIGTKLPRLDGKAKSTGKAVFAIDVAQPGMLVALVQRPPRFGAAAASVDDKAARAVKGVVDVVRIPRGVAVVADGYYAASKGREALKVTWDEAKAETRGTPELLAAYKALLDKPGQVAASRGDASVKGARTITADYEFPYLAHAPMEPLSCVVKLSPGGLEIWAGDQFQTIDQANAAREAGLKPEQVRINTVMAGGSFGRRANIESDYIVEAVGIAKALAPKHGGNPPPVKLIWTREDDIRGGRYRPAFVHRLSAELGPKGEILAWRHRLVGQPILTGTPFAPPDKPDPASIEGAANLPYSIPNLQVDLHSTQAGVPVLWWRSVGSTHTAFAVEEFLDRIAAETRQDPLALRRALLKDHPRHLAVLNLAAEKAGWGTKLPKGRARGIAVHESFHSYVAQVAEVSQDAQGRIRVDRVVCAVDCGIAVNPDVIRAQMEGGIGFGLGAALYGAITLTGGQVDQSNFHDYRCLRIDEMPKVEVHIVPSTEAPTGVGEPGVPPAAPAVANAIAALTGKRVDKLPFAAGLNV